MIEDELTEQIIGAAIEVHKHWGPGLYEEIYERSLGVELRLRNISFENQKSLPLIYKGERVGDDLRLDFVVQNKVVVELKTVTQLEAIHEAQLLTYMKLTQCRVGLLINFNVPTLKQGLSSLRRIRLRRKTDGAMKAPVFLSNTDRSIKSEMGAPSISDLMESPLLFSPPCLRGENLSLQKASIYVDTKN